jgi:hypothetical protein
MSINTIREFETAGRYWRYVLVNLWSFAFFSMIGLDTMCVKGYNAISINYRRLFTQFLDPIAWVEMGGISDDLL